MAINFSDYYETDPVTGELLDPKPDVVEKIKQAQENTYKKIKTNGTTSVIYKKSYKTLLRTVYTLTKEYINNLKLTFSLFFLDDKVFDEMNNRIQTTEDEKDE